MACNFTQVFFCQKKFFFEISVYNKPLCPSTNGQCLGLSISRSCSTFETCIYSSQVRTPFSATSPTTPSRSVLYPLDGLPASWHTRLLIFLPPQEHCSTLSHLCYSPGNLHLMLGLLLSSWFSTKDLPEEDTKSRSLALDNECCHLT